MKKLLDIIQNIQYFRSYFTFFKYKNREIIPLFNYIVILIFFNYNFSRKINFIYYKNFFFSDTLSSKEFII